jgi:hypothetical protein
MIFENINLVTAAETVSNQLQQNVCSGDTKTIRCEKTPFTDFTVIVNEAVQGVKQYSTNQCGLTLVLSHKKRFQNSINF